MKINGYTISEISNFNIVWRTGNNLRIEKNGKTCVHSYRPSKADRETKTAQQIGQDILADFYTTATIGAKGYTWYKDQFGRNYSTEAERKQAFTDYRRAFEGLKRLNPEAHSTNLI